MESAGRVNKAHEYCVLDGLNAGSNPDLSDTMLVTRSKDATIEQFPEDN